jgi:hypothetical protein
MPTGVSINFSLIIMFKHFSYQYLVVVALVLQEENTAKQYELCRHAILSSDKH